MKKFFKSFVYAINGIISMIRHRNLMVQVTFGLIAIGAGFYVKITPVEWCVLLVMIAIVIGFEMINTAIENLVDLVTRERKPLAGKIKDIAAGAVLFVSVIAVFVGIIIFKKYIIF